VLEESGVLSREMKNQYTCVEVNDWPLPLVNNAIKIDHTIMACQRRTFQTMESRPFLSMGFIVCVYRYMEIVPIIVSLLDREPRTAAVELYHIVQDIGYFLNFAIEI
jgi:hypothetical protein